MTTPGAGEDLSPELAAAEITGFAALYAAFGYETPSDQLFALLCDVTAVYAAAERTPGCSRSDAVESVLDAVADNLAPERAFQV